MAPQAKRSRSTSTNKKSLAKQVRLTDSFRQKKIASSQNVTGKKLQPQSSTEVVPPAASHTPSDEVEDSAREIETEGEVESQELSAPPEEDVQREADEQVVSVEPEVEEPLDYDDPQYRAYFDKTQKVNIAAPIHQQGVSTVLRILKNFDLTAAYGPTVGMTRLQRWHRAEKMGLKPPEVVYKILISKEGKSMDELREGYLYGQI
ncbi:DNA polymerase delta, subunit 4-domain-containing protein [Lipomyces chichibuensis]|uniref:DNA polymerase delta, subunit 4-domain-containing protein n=1 Tax=Lipomyces chichibuensis TaxID=1546026 RepID=UPI003342F878